MHDLIEWISHQCKDKMIRFYVGDSLNRTCRLVAVRTRDIKVDGEIKERSDASIDQWVKALNDNDLSRDDSLGGV